MKFKVISTRWKNIQAIWHNEHQDDVGVEKILRLFLTTSNFLFPGVYIKQIFSNHSLRTQEIVTDTFVLFKLIFPFVIILNGWYLNPWIFGIMIWLMMETLNYVPILIFASDLFNPPRSYRRSMLLLLINYFEIVLDFGAIYARLNGFNKSFDHWFDPIYFSFSTSASLGLGDYFPISTDCKVIVSFQSIIFFVYVVLFINIFSNKVEHKGYFSKSKTV